jgi:hypothetical protein
MMTMTTTATSHLTHLKHIEQLELVGAKGMQVEKVSLVRNNGEWILPNNEVYDWYFYIVDGKFVLNHPHTAELKKLQDDLLATQRVDLSNADCLTDKVNCNARICARLDDAGKNNQRLFIKCIDSTIIVKIDFEVHEGVNLLQLPEQVMVTSEWLHEGKLFWVTNMPYSIYPTKNTFNALKINEETPAGNWHVKLYLRDECFASISFRIEDNMFN